MSRFDTISPEFQSLLLAACSEDATQVQLAQLEELVDAESEMQLLIDYLQLDGELHRIVCQQASEDKCLEMLGYGAPSDRPATERSKSVPPILRLPFNTADGTFGYFPSSWPVAYLLATVILGVGLLIGSVVHMSQPPQVARPSTLPSPFGRGDGGSGDSPLPSIVGRITGMVDCQWEKEGFGIRDWGLENPKSKIQNPKSLVALGDRFALSSGLMEITYGTGAKVILQGPVTYEVESAAGGYLSVGKLTARLEKKAESGKRKAEDESASSAFGFPLSAFTVRTPTAIVTDLGTEFGVEVDKQGGTTSHVFRGSVRLQIASADGKSEGIAKVLHENETARVERIAGNQDGDNCVKVVDAAAKPAEFVRTIPKQTIKVLDLVDVVAGGDGFSGRRNAGIDLLTGRPTTVPPPGNHIFVGDGKYHRVEGMPFVDGVFVPNGGTEAVQLDSAGHTFAEFRNDTNKTAEHVWACGTITMPPDAAFTIPTMLDGIDYASEGHGFIFMHSNKGVTFDLAAIRNANSEYRLTRFQSMACNMGEMADLWVFVDGRLRFRRRQINNTHGGFAVSVPIADSDRFLTLVATDGGDAIAGDWTMFGDPRLELLPRVEGK